MIRNPILRGFNPDPSICRAGNDYYIATSTFEWYPGVQIHRSRDLVTWRLVCRPLDRASQLDLRGSYELHPAVHLLTSKDAPDAPLQRAGHGQIVETPDGAVYHTHLCSRPLPGTRMSPLGRETAIQKCVWKAVSYTHLTLPTKA